MRGISILIGLISFIYAVSPSEVWNRTYDIAIDAENNIYMAGYLKEDEDKDVLLLRYSSEGEPCDRG